MLPPAEYAERYRNLEVPFDDGAVTVRVDQYRLGDPKPGSAHAKDDLWQGLKDHFQETSAPAYWVVESTGGKGLVESWYAFQPAHDKRGKDVPGVFKVFRGSKGSEFPVRVFELG